ncbi:MAG: HEAT repeat domain-containing protein [Terracidiphilus sp.]
MLLGLGVKDGPYWDYLANRAREALKDPSPVPFDFDGRGEYSKKFIDWANKHHKSGKDAIIYSMTVSVVPIAELIPPKDPRAIPILREALQADNVIIQTTAAKGLAALHDTASIPAIIHACQSSPKEGAEMIAEPLVFFSDPAAQHAVDLYVPEEMAKELREAVAQGKTPFNLGSDRADAPPH